MTLFVRAASPINSGGCPLRAAPAGRPDPSLRQIHCRADKFDRDGAASPLRCHLYPPMNDSHPPWTSSRGPVRGFLRAHHAGTGKSIRPLLQGVEVREIPSDSDVGYIVIAVPRSPDAPHAVSDSQKGKGLHYPVRVGRTTHYLSEYEVAVRYRDRYASRVEVATALDRVHEDGLAHVATWVSPWLAVSLTPVVAAERGIGAAAINAEKQFLSEWAASKPIVGPASFSPDDRIVPGIRRVIVTQTPQYRGRSKELHAELHYNGAGFGTSNDASPPPVESCRMPRRTWWSKTAWRLGS